MFVYRKNLWRFLEWLFNRDAQTSTARGPWCFKTRSSKTFIVLGCILAIFTDCFLYGIVVSVAPFALAERAGIESGDVGRWTTALLACYAGASLVFSPIAGHLTDYFNSRRPTFVIGLVIAAGATVLLCIGSSLEFFILGRILQGASSSFTWTTALTLTVDTVEGDAVGRIMGHCYLGMSLALLLSPLIGGILYERGGYYSVFGLGLGLLSVDGLWRLSIIETVVSAQRPIARGREYWTFAYGANGTPRIVPLPAGQEIPHLELSRPGNLDLQQRFVHIWRRVTGWTTVLRDTRLQVALWASLAQVTLVTSLDAVLPLFVQRVFSWGPQGAGLIFVPLVIPSFLAPFIGSLTDKYGAKWLVSVGFLAAMPAYILLRLVKYNNVGQAVLLCGLLSLLGVAMSFVGAPLMAEITLAVEARERRQPGIFGSRRPIAQAYAYYFVFVSGGLLIGPLWAGLVENFAGWKVMTCTFGLYSGLMVTPACVCTGGFSKSGTLEHQNADTATGHPDAVESRHCEPNVI